MSATEQGTPPALRVLIGHGRGEQGGRRADLEQRLVVFRLDQLMYEQLDWLLSWCETAELPPNLARLTYRARSLRQALHRAPTEQWLVAADDAHGADAAHRQEQLELELDGAPGPEFTQLGGDMHDVDWRDDDDIPF